MATYRVTANKLNIRQEPSLSAAVIGVLEQDEQVEVMEKSADFYWYHLKRRDGLTGWASHKFLVSLENDGEIQAEEFPWMPVAIRELGVKEYSGEADNPRHCGILALY